MENLENAEIGSGKSKLSTVISRVLNFLCALVITLIVMLAIAAFLSADLHSKNMLGDYDSQIYSFVKTTDNTAELIVFGEKFTVDFEKIHNAEETIGNLSRLNEEYTPMIFVMCGDIISDCVYSVADSFKKIPSIVEYLYNQTKKK